jgi:hypothetical protein
VTKRNRWKAELPSSVTTALNELRTKKQRSEFQDYVIALRANRWSLASIATPTGLSRERIRQLDEPIGVELAISNTQTRGYDIPSVPVKPVVAKVQRVVVAPSSDIMARLLELKPMAQAVRGKSQKYRAQGTEYTRLIAQEIARGVTPSHIAKELGVTPSALNFRLVRYGYSETSSSSKCYQPIAYSETN